MRGWVTKQATTLSLVGPEQRVPAHHPIRRIKALADEQLESLSPVFTRMYAQLGRPSIPPETLLKACLLIALFSVRGERAFCERLDYDLMFRFFLDMSLEEESFNASTFAKNKERLLEADVARLFFEGVVKKARRQKLLSSEHFTVEGTLIEAWASLKSFKSKEKKDEEPPDDPGNPTVNFHGEKRGNATHASTTDGEARLARKGWGKEARLSYAGHVLMENRNGLCVDVSLSLATGKAEREEALVLHVAQNQNERRRSNVDARTTRHEGYALSQRARKKVEEIFGWMKTVGGMRKTRYRGQRRVGLHLHWVAAAYNLVRMAKLMPMEG